MSIALYAMFSLKKRFAKLSLISGFELMISCKQQGHTNHCTTSVDAEMCLCMVLVQVYLILHCRENVTLWLVSDILRGARSASRPGHDVSCMGLLVHLDSQGPDSEVLALRLPGRLPVNGLGAGAAVIVAISACCPAQCHASKAGPAQCHASTAGTSILKPESTPLQNKIKTICEPAGRFLNYLKQLLHLKR